MTAFVALVVEGHTEQNCLEPLLQRIWHEVIGAPFRLQVVTVSRGHRDRLVAGARPDLAAKVAEGCVKLVGRATTDPDATKLLLLLLDAEGECPKLFAPPLHAAAQAARPDVPVGCVLACRMLENWFVAGAGTLAGVNGLPDTLPDPVDYEAMNGAGWLDERLREVDVRRKYKKSTDAKLYVRQFDLVACRQRSSSFDKLCRELARLVPPPPPPTAGDDSTSA